MGAPKSHRGDGNPASRLMNLQLSDPDRRALEELFHELHVHQDELSAQNTQLLETQQALEESRDRYVELFDFAPIGYLTINGSGIIKEINLTGASLFGKERGKIIGLPFNAFLITADKRRFSEHLRACREDSHGGTIELTLGTTTGSPTFVQLLTRPHRDSDGQPVFLSAMIDVTARKHFEREQREAEDARTRLARDREVARARADAKDHFLAMLSHELRTPLTPIMATISDRRLVALAPEPLRSALDTVRRNLDLEVRLIDDLLDVTRISRDRLILARERVDVHQVVQEIVDMLAQDARQRGVSVTANLEAPTPWVVGDPTRLRQVFWNLLGNALKFTDAGGRVTVTSGTGPDGSIRVTVGDSGVGMDEETCRSINEPDPDSPALPIQSASGLGLGLAICRAVVDAHGGTLRASSAGKGRGSLFVVQIPVASHLERWNEPRGYTEQPHPDHVRPRRILLVEDHQDSADLLSQLLAMHDYDVTVARTTHEALALTRQGFDLLISDIRLPDGNGLDLMRTIRKDRPVRGIAISGFGTEEDRVRSREAGYETHLTKPVDFNRLLDAIERVQRAR